MTTSKQEHLINYLQRTLANRLPVLNEQFGEITIVIRPEDLLGVCKILRDDSELDFDTLIDLCGIDYSAYNGDSTSANSSHDKRFAVIYHLLSINHNHRLRIKVFAESDQFPVINSVIDIWPAVNWFEREAFDLYGIVFPGHPDLRRILTDYGFIGNPFRKDFPLFGNVEMRYDDAQKRVIYQPVSIEPRQIVPHVIREEHYGDSE